MRLRRQLGLGILWFAVVTAARHCVAPVFIGIGKALLLLVLASLLMFLVVRAADLFLRLTASLRSLARGIFEPPQATLMAARLAAVPAVSRQPRQPFRFQLPPPAPSR
jgi:hypothetical protein